MSPVYEYVKGDAVQTVKCSFAEFEHMDKRMRRKGFRQRYSLSRPKIFLTYQEALEETDELLAQADRGEGELVGMDRYAEKKRRGDWF